MRVSVNWLRDYLDLRPDVDIHTISESLTMAGLEVEHVHSLLEYGREILVGSVVSIEEESANLAIYAVKIGTEIVSAMGPLANIGLKAVVGIKPVDGRLKYRLANYGDLGLTLGNQELLHFGALLDDAEHLRNLFEIKEFDDVIITLGITPNRADALSHLGVSRELSALLDVNARSPMLTPREMAGPVHEKVAIEIENSDDCPRYACRLVENVEVKESPYWLKLRLLCAGIRPINNVVDVTNYVMLSRGQPMHAFDYDQLHLENARAKIVVKRAKENESFRALDGKELTLTHSDVIISDGEHAIALAGVIGGASCGVTKATKTVLFESAYFDPKAVRMTARRHGITTESSYRFERGVDPNGVVDALNYAARLLTEISDARVCREVIDAYRKRIDPQEIKMRPERAQAVLGIDAKDFDQDLLRKRFLRLGIETVAKRGDAIYFLVPTYRADLTREIDLIEEAARMIGYDKVRTKPAAFGAVAHEFVNPNVALVSSRLRGRLLARGFFEAINYAFLSQQLQSHFVGDFPHQAIEIQNPLSDRYAVMRLALVPGLIKNLLHNQRNQEKSVLLFELGTVFLGTKAQGKTPKPSILQTTLDQDSYCIEKTMLAGVLAGNVPYLAFDQPIRVLDFYHVKGIVADVLQSIGLSEQYPVENLSFDHGASAAYFHPGESATINYRPNDETKQVFLGNFGKLHPQVGNELDVVGDVFIFELDIERMADIMLAMPRFKPFSRYPSVERDVAFVADESIQVSDILNAIQSVPNAKDTLVDLRVFDIFRGKNIGSGRKSIAISMLLQKQERTLTDDEADQFIEQVTAAVLQATGAHVR